MPILKVLAGSSMPDDKFEPKPGSLDVPYMPVGESKKVENFELAVLSVPDKQYVPDGAVQDKKYVPDGEVQDKKYVLDGAVQDMKYVPDGCSVPDMKHVHAGSPMPEKYVAAKKYVPIKGAHVGSYKPPEKCENVGDEEEQSPDFKALFSMAAGLPMQKAREKPHPPPC